MELNPNNEMTASVREHWQKLCALAVAKAGGEITITPNDIRAMGGDGFFLTVGGEGDDIVLRLVSKEEAERLARMHGGLPT